MSEPGAGDDNDPDSGSDLRPLGGTGMACLSPWPLRCLLAAAVLTPVLAAVPAMVQATAQTPRQQPGQKPQASLDGLPVYTADGKAIGTVITMGLDEDDKPVLVAEIAQALGLGPTAVAVPTNMFVRKGNRIELTLTEAEVNARLKQ